MPTSWNVTPHRDEHGYPATMTGDDCMKVLDFDTEPAWMRIHATEIMVINGKGWLEGRLQHYREKSNALFRPTGKELAEAPDRTAQLIAEILLRQVGKDLKDMEIESEPYESLMADYDEESNEECWSSSMTFMALYLQGLQGILAWGTRSTVRPGVSDCNPEERF